MRRAASGCSIPLAGAMLRPSLCFVSEIEAKKACDWLRAAGFPQYAQLYEGESCFLLSWVWGQPCLWCGVRRLGVQQHMARGSTSTAVLHPGGLDPTWAGAQSLGMWGCGVGAALLSGAPAAPRREGVSSPAALLLAGEPCSRQVEPGGGQHPQRGHGWHRSERAGLGSRT